MNFIERWFRRRAMRRDDLTEDQMPAALRAMPIGFVFSANGYRFRVVHRRCGKRGSNPGVVIVPLGPTRRALKLRRNALRRLIGRKPAAA